MVRWLAEKLRDNGLSVAVLSRGYKSAAGQLGDEQIMLDRLLNAPGLLPGPAPCQSRPYRGRGNAAPGTA